MNPYSSFSDLLFTCVTGPLADVVHTMLTGLNEPPPSDVERAFANPGCNEVQVFEQGVAKVYRRGDPMPPRIKTCQYFKRDMPLDFSLAYIDHAERDMRGPQRIIFWEPRIHPGVTAFMGVFHDGLSHSVRCMSLDSPYTWVNVRIYNDIDYPGCFFDYYADHRKVFRRLMACKDEEGWDFSQEGSVQSFEDPGYYDRRLKKDRLSREIITEYMDKLGFMIAQDDFWQTDNPATFLWQER